jgi:hypothetical protein
MGPSGRIKREIYKPVFAEPGEEPHRSSGREIEGENVWILGSSGENTGSHVENCEIAERYESYKRRTGLKYDRMDIRWRMLWQVFFGTLAR